MSNAEFASFLFSERDRENNISEFHGWNNWALLGAIISAILTGYTILKNNPSLVILNVVYSVNCILTFFLAYYSWSKIFSRERGVDFSKVRMLREVFPIVDVVFIFICAIALTIFVSIIDDYNSVFWLWLIIIVIYTAAIIVAIVFKERVVPSFFKEMVLPWLWINAGFASFCGGLFSLIGARSFKYAGRCIFTPEFEFAACISAILILLFILFKLNFGNRVVRRFDEIIDMYLYAGKSKEETFQEILKNRMGYGVLDACYKELQVLEKETERCIADEKELDEYKETAIAGKYTLDQLREKQKRIDIILNDIQDTLALSKALLSRMNEIVKVSSYFKENSEIKYILDTNNLCQEEVKGVVVKARDVSRLLHELEVQVLLEEKSLLENVLSNLMKEKSSRGL